jgi:hypothetical protein
MTITSTGVACFSNTVCTPSLVACVTSAAAIIIDGYSKLSFADRGTEYGTINASRYNFGGESTIMSFQSGNCFLFLNGTNCLMFIGSNGRVGIGTTVPARGLSLFNNTIGLYSSSTGQGGIDGYTMELSGTTAYLWNYENDSLIFGTNNCERMRITSGGSTIFQGSLGICNGGAINMTIPNGNNGGSIRMACCTGANEGDMYLTGGGGTGILIAGNGRVGIGTTTPEVSFVVKGASIGSGGKASFYGGGDENNWSANNNEAIRIGRADILNGFYSSIWSASGSGGNELQHWLRFYISNGSNAQTLALTMFGNGNVDVAGALAKGSGSFKICHPLTSKKCTHQLVHSFIEGPQADLIYRGKINLINGIACVNIDCAARMTEGTFEALNRCVQAFTTNESSWNAVRGKVQGNVLVIESQNNTSTDEISWMVIGERQDEHMLKTDWTDQEGRVITEPEIR